MGLPPSFLGASHCRSTYLLVTVLTVRAYGGPGVALTKKKKKIFYTTSTELVIQFTFY